MHQNCGDTVRNRLGPTLPLVTYPPVRPVIAVSSIVQVNRCVSAEVLSNAVVTHVSKLRGVSIFILNVLTACAPCEKQISVLLG